MKKLIVATQNQGKAREIFDLLEGLASVESLDPNVEMPKESGLTFLENAKIKSEWAATRFGEAALADDSGLVVDALGGRPGVFSARYAPGSDHDRVQKLLAELEDVSEKDRTARFVCAIAFSIPDVETITALGVVEGTIAFSPTGSGGFGYDPVFIPRDQSGEKRTMAELSREEKSQISHRGRALRSIRPHLLAHFR